METISGYALKDGESLEKIVIPDSVKIIKESAFFGCENLTSVDFGNSLETIEREAFYHCSSLTSVVIPDSVKDIYGNAFLYCESLTDFTIGKSVLSFDFSQIIGWTEEPFTITLKNAGTDLINVPSSVQVIKPKAKSLREQMQERNDK